MGLLPIYIDYLREINAVEVVAHRTLWSFSCLTVLVFVGRVVKNRFDLPTFAQLGAVFKSARLLRNLVIAAALIATNWLTFVWAVNNDHKLDASLGYYICPQVIVLLGVVFLRERLNSIQWIAFVLAAIGVLWIAQSGDSVPWVGLVVAFSFGFYGLMKKTIQVSSFVGLFFETGFLLLPAIGFLLYQGWPFGQTVVGQPWWLNLMLVGTGVITIAPLLFYATAVKHIPLSTVGLLQFIGPTIQFVIGTLVFGEPFDSSRLIGFTFVWIGVGLFMFAIRWKRQTA